MPQRQRQIPNAVFACFDAWPISSFHNGFPFIFALPVLRFLWFGIALRALVKRHFNRVHDESGVETNTLAYSLLLLLVLPVMVYLILG
jgi:hypothetical protein